MRHIRDHEINDFNVDCVQVVVLDEPDDEKGGGACHQYGVLLGDAGPEGPGTIIQFQHGPVKEYGVNGLSGEALMAVVIDRLRSFQAGPFACRENALALTNMEQALMWLHKRTLDRVRRNVEGEKA